ncbi:MAG: helix-turn-helix domain-containing protein [Bdellovibrionota bacterium]
MLTKSFQTLGFGDKEQQVFLALVEAGKASATALSKQTKLPRATLYAVLETLLEKGVISRDPLRGSRLFIPNKLTAINRLVEQHREQLAEKEAAAADLIESLAQSFRKSEYAAPKLQFFEGRQNIENMLYEYWPVWRESYSRSSNYTLWGYQDHTFVESYRKWHLEMWASRGTEEKIRLFSNTADIEKELHHQIPHREVRALPKGVQFSSSMWIYGDYIVMAVTGKPTHYAYQIKDPLLAGNLRTIFELMWNARF